MNADGLLKHYECVADAPDAIARLRRFILDLAVRGKLVPQNQKDEPASELLNRLAKEKTRLAKAGVIRQRNTLPELSTSTVPFVVPTTWCWCRIGDLGVTQTGTTPPKVKAEHYGDYVPFIKPGDLYPNRVDYSNEGLSQIGAKESGRIAGAGSILMVCIGTIGKCQAIDRDCSFNQQINSLSPCGETSSRYLLAVWESEFFQQAAWTASARTTIAILNKGNWELLPIPLPPLAEQHRIVAKVDELMALCDRLEAARAEREATRDRLAAASLARLNAPDPATFHDDARFALDALPALTTRPDQIKHLRQTILNLAVRGKLVPQDPSDEPASELLKRLKKAQIAACSSEGLRARSPVAKLSRGDMWFDFPDSWALSFFDDLFVIVSGVTKGQKVAAHEAVDAPYLRVANVQRGHLDLSVIKKITVRKTDEERYALRHGDVLMTEGGDWDKLGRAAIWREEVPGCIHQNHIFRVRPPSRDISPEWMIAYVNSLLGRAFFEDASKQTTNLASINMTQLRGCPFPLPPLAEQHRIVTKVNALMALCDRLEASLTATAATRRRLLDALLAEALAPTQSRQEAA